MKSSIARILLILAFPLLLSEATRGSEHPSVPFEVRHAAELSVHDHKGIIGYESAFDTNMHGGPLHRAYHYRNAYLYNDEHLLKARALYKDDNGQIADAAQLQTETTKIETEQGSGKVFAVPFDARHFSEYRYDRAECSGCAQGEVAFTFTSLVQDEFHGSGSMTLESGGHIRLLTYVPSVLPAHASAARITVHRSEVLPGYWATVKSEGHYEGRYGLIHGGADMQSRNEHFHRFSSVDTAVTALYSGKI